MLVHDYLSNSATKFGSKVALVYGKNRLSYDDLANQARKIAGWLLNKGLARGDRVAILTDNPSHYISCYFGSLMAGAVGIGINTQTSERSLDTLLKDCRPSFFMLSGRNRKYQEFLETHRQQPQVSEIEKLFEEKTALPGDLPEVAEHDIAQIMYTSGTTGRPKGVMLTHANLTANTESIIEYLGLTDEDTAMAVLPFFYSYGNSVMLTHLAVGGTLVVNQSFVYPNVILDQMVEERVTGLAGVPSTFAILMHRSAARDYSFPDLRFLTQAGAAMSPKLARQLKEIFPNCDIYIMYGQTEAAPRLSYLSPDDLLRKPGSIGKAIPGVTMNIVREDGAEAAPGEIGEIVASGANIMAGYWERPEETRKVLRDGKLWTGDLAYQDEDGYFFIVSRKSDMIKSGSHRIAPKEIEEVLAEMAGVAECAVIGTADEILGEKIHAYIVPQMNAILSPTEVTRFCRQNLPAFKVPHEITIIEELPKSESGKVRKQDLK